jgi:hypothetical protein
MYGDGSDFSLKLNLKSSKLGIKLWGHYNNWR